MVLVWFDPHGTEAKLAGLKTQLTRIERKLKTMSDQEQELGTALTNMFTAIDAGLTRIEAKLAEAPDAVDLTDEIASIRAAASAFTARVDTDLEEPEPTP